MCRGEGGWELRGLESKAECVPYRPSTFTDMSHVEPWIKTHVAALQ